MVMHICNEFSLKGSNALYKEMGETRHQSVNATMAGQTRGLGPLLFSKSDVGSLTSPINLVC